MVYMDKEVLEEMDSNETILVKAYGQGLKLLDYPEIHMMNIDPDLLTLCQSLKKREKYRFQL
mgnify:CR=1 FL=1